MSQQPPTAGRVVASLALIGAVVVAASGAFAYTAGWLSPERLTPARLVAALAPKSGPALGHRRNHAKGICFTGVFRSNGAGTAFAPATVFTKGEYPVLGRFNLGTPDPKAPDATVRVRGVGIDITAPDGEVWRSAMINLPFFPVSTPEAFHDLLVASHSDDPEAMKGFAAGHPELAAFGAWAGSAPWTASYAEERYNSINAFRFTAADGTVRPVRWALVPAATPVPITNAALTALGPDHLETEIAARVAEAPQSWSLVLTVAAPGDPVADPSKAWPEDRETIDVGSLVVTRIEAERDGPCRDINFDPTILPPGISVSEDPFPAARSAAYARSYDLRTAETKDYPYQSPDEGPTNASAAP